MIGGVVLAGAVQDLRSQRKSLGVSDKSSADRALANLNVARRSCDLEGNQVVDARRSGR
jgi:hypothetical protein